VPLCNGLRFIERLHDVVGKLLCAVEIANRGEKDIEVFGIEAIIEKRGTLFKSHGRNNTDRDNTLTPSCPAIGTKNGCNQMSSR
jgi:hypothetical protein